MNILKFEILVLQIIFIQPIVSAIVVDKMNRSMLFFFSSSSGHGDNHLSTKFYMLLNGTSIIVVIQSLKLC